MGNVEFATEERTELAEFLGTLTSAEWDSPSLCEGWRVRDVVAHMISYDGLGPAGVLRRFVRGRFRPAVVNEIGVQEYSHEPDRLLELLDERLTPRGFPTWGDGRIAFLDGLIHHQDIRRGLGKQRDVPPERLAVALPLSLGAPPLRAKGRTHGLRLIADDIDVALGEGAEVRGPGEALLLAMAGRRGVVDELTGPGQSVLAERIGG